MRYKSEETNKLLEILREKGLSPESIKEFGFRETGAIPDFFSLCCYKSPKPLWDRIQKWFYKTPEVDNTCGWEHLCKWLQRVPIIDLAWLDLEFRIRSTMLGLYHLEFDEEAPFLARCLMTFAENGRVREAALKSIAKNSTGEELPFLLIRLNDWVEPVQQLAYRLIGGRLENEDYISHFLTNLSLVDRLRDCWRGPHRDFVANVYKLISSGDSNKILEVLENGDRYSATAAFRLYEEALPDDITTLVKSALKSKHSRLHLKCSSKIKSLDNEEFLQVERFLLTSRPPLRVSAILSFCKRFPDKQIDYLKTHLLDPGAFVRETVIWKLRKLEEGIDIAQFYRDSLKDKLSVSGIIALGQFGDPNDATLFREVFEGSHTRKLRKAAFESLIRLDVSDSLDLLFDHLGEAGFAKIARRLLGARITSNEKDRLLETYYAGNEIARVSVEKLLHDLTVEDHGICIMRLSLRFPKFIKELVWFLDNSNFYCVRDKKKKEMVALYDQNIELFDPEIKKKLEFTFKRWR